MLSKLKLDSETSSTVLQGRVYHYYRFNYYYSHLSIHELLVDL